MPRIKDIKKVLVIGSGPIIIGQAAEFDYAGTQACRSLKEEGLEVVLLNSNPATIMTDKDIADRVYIEPLTVEVVEQLILKEKPDSVLPTLGEQVVEQQQIITELQPKANYVDMILQSKSLVTITQIAKDYGMRGRKLNKILKELKIQYKVGGQWVLYSKYQNGGYVHSRTIDITRTDGRADVAMQTEWTQKGRLFLYEELKKHRYVPVIEQVA